MNIPNTLPVLTAGAHAPGDRKVCAMEDLRDRDENGKFVWKSDIERFSVRYIVALTSGCWEWTGSPNEDGYGGFRLNGRQDKAHRASWVLHNGPIPAGLSVLHRCDNPPCVNPAHLFLGTLGENNTDRHRKGRTVTQFQKGNHPRLVMTEEKIEEARHLRAKGWAQQDIADHFNVSRGRIAHIVSGTLPPHTWRKSHVHS